MPAVLRNPKGALSIFVFCALVAVATTLVDLGDRVASAADPRVVQIEVGLSRSCAVLADGRITCWMSDWQDGEVEARSLRYRQVSMGDYRTCALTLDGRLICDGWEVGESGVRYRSVSVDGTNDWSVCAIREDRSVWCLDRLDSSPLALPDERDFDSLSIAGYHACAVRSDGTVHCWLPLTAYHSILPLKPPAGRFVSVSVANGFACGLRIDGRISCWGRDRHGETAAPEGRYLSVDAGHGRACAVRQDASLACWGDVRLGEKLPQGRYRAVSVGRGSHCAITEAGQVACWGERDGTWNGAPAQEAPAGPFVKVVQRAGNGLCLLRADGDLFCNARFNYPFHRAHGSVTALASPGEICAVLADTTLSCTVNRSEYPEIPSDVQADWSGGVPAGQFSAVAGHQHGYPPYGHWCALRLDGGAQCWGADAHGQASAPAGRFTQIAIADRRSCGLRESGRVSCWGAPFGDESPMVSRPPVEVLREISTLAVTHERVCGLQSDGRVSCWDGQTAWRSDPSRQGYTHLELSAQVLCALRTDQHVDCWLRGRVGLDDLPLSAVLESGEPARFRAISVIGGRICGAHTSGGVVCTHAHGGSSPWRRIPRFGDEIYNWLSIGPDKEEGTMRCAITVQGDAICLILYQADPLRVSGLALRAEEWSERVAADGRWRGRFNLRRLSSGSTELRFTPAPTGSMPSVARTLSLQGSGATDSAWTSAGEVIAGGARWGQLQARQWRDGSIEASLVAPGGERVLAHARFLPGDAPADRWFDSGETSVPAPATMIAATGERFRSEMAWVLRSDGALEPQRRSWLKRADADGPYLFIDGGADALCAVLSDGTATCSGRLHAEVPDERFTSVSVGRRHACGVRIDGGITCWGANQFGESDPPAGRFQTVSAGGAHTCGVRADGQVRCWGLDWQGQATAPTGRFTLVAAGMAHTCGLTDDGRISCWGANGQQQSRPPSSLTSPDERYRSVSVADWHACAVTTSGSAVCWGAPDLPGSEPPRGQVFRSIFTFAHRTYAITDAGGVVWWGLDDCDFSTVEMARHPHSLNWHPLPLISIPSDKALCPH
ncbi:MAG: hypothetical protein F4Y35_03860 [Chloroflexi bacterium]|nr:hypothetical protein [Chloroflexota bacterium]